MYNPTPKVGMLMTVHNITCRIIAVLPMGTVDVVSLDGSKHYRVTGLGF